jgi:outer membrane lipoprotein-sorting protein
VRTDRHGPGAPRPARGVPGGCRRIAAAAIASLLLASLLAAGSPSAGGAPAPPAFVSKVAAFRPRTVECRVTITLFEGPGFTLEMYLWARPPALWRIDVTGVNPNAPPQNAVVGARMVFNNDRVRLFDPATGRILEQPVSPALASRPGASGRMGFTLAEMLLVDDATNYDLVAMVPQSVEGRALVRYDFVLRRPQLVDRVLVARESIWVDPQGGEPVRAQLYDPDNRAVGIIVLKDHRKVAGGVALPMTLEMFMESGGPTTVARVTFQLKEGKVYLPNRIDAYQGTRAVLSLTYSSCRVNHTIDPARFQL